MFLRTQALTRNRFVMLAALLALTAFAACEQDNSGQLLPTGQVQAEPFEHPDLDVPPKSRAIKRLTVAQLRNSISVFAGDDTKGRPVIWSIERDGRTVDALGESGVARALGEPDYVEVTEELAEPTALYVKFMDDMARDVCERMVQHDASPSAGERNLARLAALDGSSPDADVNANLRYLKLRLLGERLADDDDAAVADLKTVYDRILSASNDGAEAWHGVCVAIVSSPAFHLY